MFFVPVIQVVLILFMEGWIPEETLYISSSYAQRQAEEAAVFGEWFTHGLFIMRFKEQ
jgi:hypothetical protein